ncbi:hypothetical protein BSKO_08147 [Bryopsis sp. KO-2023]|nr:hypothetical protein BSKO_08147 [Bryopsis sp. KO-2023]
MLRQFSRRVYRVVANPQTLAPLSRGLKETTGLVGVEVDPNARENLINSLHKVKGLVADMIPETAEYRKIVEQTCDYKLKLISEHESNDELEGVLGLQLEQELMLCQDELGLIPKMAEWKPWEVPEGHQVPVFQEDDPMETGQWHEPIDAKTHQSLPPPPQQ